MLVKQDSMYCCYELNTFSRHASKTKGKHTVLGITMKDAGVGRFLEDSALISLSFV